MAGPGKCPCGQRARGPEVNAQVREQILLRSALCCRQDLRCDLNGDGQAARSWSLARGFRLWAQAPCLEHPVLGWGQDRGEARAWTIWESEWGGGGSMGDVLNRWQATMKVFLEKKDHEEVLFLCIPLSPLLLEYSNAYYSVSMFSSWFYGLSNPTQSIQRQSMVCPRCAHKKQINHPVSCR